MISNFYLTKSAFRVALSCPTKLYYLASNYPTAKEENEYLKLLAEGGYMVGALAQLFYPAGVVVPKTGDPVSDFNETKSLLAAGDTVLFEATLLSGRKLAVTDILERKGDVLRLIEVKSKSFDSLEAGADAASIFRNKKGEISSEWKEYLYDITFQFAVLSECFPTYKVEPFLILVDKKERVSLEALPSSFKLTRSSEWGRASVEILGDKTKLAGATNILSELNVLQEVLELLPLVAERVTLLEKSLLNSKKIAPILSTQCRDCEYCSETLKPSGYDECWSHIPPPEQHVFDLFYGTTIKEGGILLLDQLIQDGKASLYDIPLEALKGKRGERQAIQIECTKNNKEWFDPKLASFLKDLRYPLHFIDFETTRAAIPFHVGMRPFEQIAFQWSCHTVSARGSAPIHTEWINTEAVFPNFTFARALMNTLSKEGTLLTWATHEGAVLSDILEQMERYGDGDSDLLQFLKLIVSSKGSQGRLVDMNRLTVEHYFHPQMKGKTSIKKVFPAIWCSNAELRKIPWFKEYEEYEDGEVKDPYKNLPPLLIGGKDISIQEGTAAMRAYEEMIFGSAANDAEQKENWKKLLLQYCKLDTLAMVAIWEHWEQRGAAV